MMAAILTFDTATALAASSSALPFNLNGAARGLSQESVDASPCDIPAVRLQGLLQQLELHIAWEGRNHGSTGVMTEHEQ